MMQFMALIYEVEGCFDDQADAVMADYMTFTQEAKEAGVMVAGDPLQPVSTATSIRIRDGQSQYTDGPFAETKEQLGGYYIFDCANLDEAISWAERIPSARFGTVEVRPIMDFPG